MKKKVAIFSNGWGDEYFKEVTYGISEAAKNANFDTFAFVNFSIHGLEALLNEGEFNIFTLPELKDFDGIILLANSFNLSKELEYFTEKLKTLKIPAVSVEYKLKDTASLVSDNYAGMYELVEHVVERHRAKTILYIGGPKEHMENIDRLKALCDVAEKNGFRIPESNIRYGDWDKQSAKDLVKDWIEEHGKLPDAILCANDIMAMGTCEQLQKMNYRVPEDVIVTGFDCIRAGQEFTPAIASVGHEWVRMGDTAFQMLLKRMRGEEQEDEVLPTYFIPDESCGCFDEEYKDEMLRSGGRSRENEIDGLQADSHFRHIYLAVRKTDNAEDLSESLANQISGEHVMEGDDFMLCLDPEFFRIEEDDLNLFVQGYNDKMEVIGSILGGKPIGHSVMNRDDALYWLSRHNKEPKLYICVPILGDLRTYGFAVLTGDLRIACANQYYIWTRHLSQYMEQVRRNLTISDLTRKLTQLSVTDVLTGVYNRAGCEQIAFPMLEEWKSRGGTGVIIFVDIDQMKEINDVYGHSSGDLALRTVASVLKSALPDDWIISRFGGDEFFVGGRLHGSKIDLEEIKTTLEKRLKREVKKREIVFPLTISIGVVRMGAEEELALEQCLKLADAEMYEVKQKHHNRKSL